MKKITNTYKEPIVVYLLQPKLGFRVPQRKTQNLLVGDYITVKDEEVSPETENLRKKGCVSIEDVKEEIEKEQDPQPQQPEEIKEKEEPNLEDLERELLVPALDPDEDLHNEELEENGG